MRSETIDGGVTEDVASLVQAFKPLKDRGQALADALREDRDTFPFEVMTFTNDSCSVQAHETAIESLVRLYRLNGTDETKTEENTDKPVTARPFHAGILCVSENSMVLADDFNQAKVAFKDVVLAIRKKYQNHKHGFDKWIRGATDPQISRPQELQDALDTARLSEIDLRRCYAKVRALPDQIKSISWTWAIKHSTMKKIHYAKAVERVKNLPDDHPAKSLVTDLIEQVGEDEMLVEKSDLPAALRANLVSVDPFNPDRVKRFSVAISGGSLCRQDTLPRRLWRDNPLDSKFPIPERLAREPKFDCEAEPHIDMFNWYKRKLTDNEPRYRHG